MTIREMTNSEMYCLAAIGRARGMLTAATVARMRYPHSKQLEKKTLTFTNHLNRLCRHGFAMRIQGAYTITETGQTALSFGKRIGRPVVLGLVG